MQEPEGQSADCLGTHFECAEWGFLYLFAGDLVGWTFRSFILCFSEASGKETRETSECEVEIQAVTTTTAQKTTVTKYDLKCT